MMKFAGYLLGTALLLLPPPVSAQILEPLPPETPAEAVVPADLLNASTPEPGLLAAGQPSASQLEQIAAAGYRTVLDLRGLEEDRGFDEPAKVKELGLVYRTVPVSGELDRAMLDRFREVLATAERPILVHCGTSNRVGALLFGYWMLDEGQAPEAALERAKAAGLKSAGLIDRMRELVATDKSKPDEKE